jgi:hypothetical protein
MIQLTITNEVVKRIAAGKELVELRDPDGKTLGYFAPVTEEYARRLEAHLCEIDPVELKRRRESSGPHHTTEEVFEYLLTLTDDEESRRDLRKRIEELRESHRCATP